MAPERHVEAAASAHGFDLDEETIAAYVGQVGGVVEQLESLAATTPDADPAGDVEVGDDDANAFRYRFSLDSPDGPLSDLSLAVKDNVAVAGVPMHCGSAGVDFTPEYHATVVSRLREAGGELVGTTNMDEFAYFTTGETCAFGPVDNPAAEGRVPGGSSAGSGAAVAAGDVDAALGSDTGGSIRIPASFCGVVGFKPTHRSVPRFGFADLAPSLDHVGPLARDVETAARVFDAIAGPDPRDLSSAVSRPPADTADATGEDVSGLRVGVVEEAVEDAGDGVADAVDAAASKLDDAGADVERVSVPGYREAPVALLGISGPEFAVLVEHDGLVYGSGTGYSEPWREAVADVDADELGENVRDQLVVNGAVVRAHADRYVAAQNARTAFTETVNDRLAEFDALVTPTTPMTAPAFGEVTEMGDLVATISDTAPFDLTGHPALSVPFGQSEGRPVGVQVVADYHDEPTAVALGAELERRA